KPVRLAFLVGLVAAAAAATARADHDGAPCPPSAPAMQTVTCTEWVPQNYTTTRTCYRYECKQETYTAYRCEYTTECRTRVVTRCKWVPTVEPRCRTVCTMVPAVEHRVVCKPHWHYVTETCMRTRCVDRGHYECREVYCFCQDMKNRMHRMGHRHDCC